MKYLARELISGDYLTHVIKFYLPSSFLGPLFGLNRHIGDITERAEGLASEAQTLDRVNVVELSNLRGSPSLGYDIKVCLLDSLAVVHYLEAI